MRKHSRLRLGRRGGLTGRCIIMLKFQLHLNCGFEIVFIETLLKLQATTVQNIGHAIAMSRRTYLLSTGQRELILNNPN